MPDSLHTPSTCTRSSPHKAQGSVCFIMARESEDCWFDVRPKGVGKRRPRPIHELCSESSESSNTPDATTGQMVRSVQVTCSCVTAGPSVRGSSPSATKPRPKGPGRLGVDLTSEREMHRCPRSECRSVGRHCFATSTGATEVRALLALSKAIKNTDGHFDIDIAVRVTSPLCFPERDAGAVALASRTQESPRKHRSPPRRRKAVQKHRQATRIVSSMWSCGVILRYLSCAPVTSSSSANG